MRAAFIVLHRWAGMVTAMFLLTSGITGAVISWDHEIDERLNPHLFKTSSEGAVIPPTDLADIVERRDPHARVTYFPLKAGSGETIRFFVAPRVDHQTGKRYALSYNQVFVDPVSGNEVGRRSSIAAWPITRENFVSFLYRFHYSLHIPEFWGSNRWGVWLLGVIAMIWTLDCFVGFYLTLPVSPHRHAVVPPSVEHSLRPSYWRRWRPAWLIKTRASAFRVNFDIHRAIGLWTWGILFVIAFTGFSLNLQREVFVPLMRVISSYTPTPYDLRKPAPPDRPILPRFSFGEIVDRAGREAYRRGWPLSPAAIGYNSSYGIFSVRFQAEDEDHGAGGAGPAQLYYDGREGNLIGDRVPWTGTAADIFVQAQFPVHSGRILGLPGRVLISVMGLLVAMLSITGLVIWRRKLVARARSRG